MNTIQEINQAIMFGNLTNTELDSVISAIKFRRNQLMKENKRSMTLGDTVKFYSSKRSMEIKGNVIKIAKKYVTVDTQTGLWRVPANMLEVA